MTGEPWRLRDATAADLDAIAAMHAESWRRTYRGMYSDDYLDNRVVADRRAVWVERFTRRDPDHHTVVAERDGVLVGFVHTILHADDEWGALLDNLHVANDCQRTGLGTRLMARSAATVLERAPGERLHLWVLELNRGAQAFYEARRGECVQRSQWDAPDGTRVDSRRYAWRDPAMLLTFE